jgi:hypothetical protein
MIASLIGDGLLVIKQSYRFAAIDSLVRQLRLLANEVSLSARAVFQAPPQNVRFNHYLAVAKGWPMPLA